LKVVLPAILVLLSSLSAWAGDIPRFDVGLHCASTGESGGVAACQQAEATARGIVVERWSIYLEQQKHFCVQSERFRRKEESALMSVKPALSPWPRITDF
jgi:hypothetical protein